jgi:Tfp pilus assembly protein PilF
MTAQAAHTPATRIQEAEEEYQLGRVFFNKKQWRIASQHFSLAEKRAPRNDAQLHLYRSWHGLALVYSQDISGLNLCRHAAAAKGIEATVFQNLVLAELKLNHRKRACEALRQGLRLDPRHRGLLMLKQKVRLRRRQCLTFLKRENPLNKWLGKMTYRRMMRRGDLR